MVSKYIILLVKSFLGNFYRHLAIFSGHTGTYYIPTSPLRTSSEGKNSSSIQCLSVSPPQLVLPLNRGVCAHHKKQEAPFRGMEGVNNYLQINKYSNWGPKISIRVLSKVLSRAKKR